jgi:hypothetical protein
MGYPGLALIVCPLWAPILCPFALGSVGRYAIRWPVLK